MTSQLYFFILANFIFNAYFLKAQTIKVATLFENNKYAKNIEKYQLSQKKLKTMEAFILELENKSFISKNSMETLRKKAW